MNRYKFTSDGIKSAIKFLKDGEDGPPWAQKYKEDLKVKGTDVFYKNKKIISHDKVGDVLREEIYKKDGDTPAGRDSGFHLLKQKYVGISRRYLMKFLQSQKALGTTRAAVAKPKKAAGKKLKKYTIETDLIFLKRNDMIRANKRFRLTSLDEVPELSYIVSTVEKVTGLCRLSPCKVKDAGVVTPIVLKHIEELCKSLRVNPSECALRKDSGTEFSDKELKKVIPDTKSVSMGASVENKNRMAQQHYFRILRQRKATTIKDALSLSQKLLNQTYNRIHKLTPNELIKRGSKEENIKEYNQKRATYIAGDKRKPFEVGDHVRLLVKEKKSGISYKSYKNQTWSEKVYRVKKVTKKAVPPKFYVNGSWYLKDNLLKTQPRDEKSMVLVLERDVEYEIKEKEGEKAHALKREVEKIKDAIQQKLVAKQGGRKLRPSKKTKQKIAATVEKGKILDKLINKLEEKDEKQKQDEQGIKSAAHKTLEIEKKVKQRLKQGKPSAISWSTKVMKAWLNTRGKPTHGTKEALKRRIQTIRKYQSK